MANLFDPNENIKPWHNIKIEKKFHKIHWLQIIHALTKTWKNMVLNDEANEENLVVFGTKHCAKIQVCD